MSKTSTLEMKSLKQKSIHSSMLNKTGVSLTKARKIKIVALGKFGVGIYTLL